MMKFAQLAQYLQRLEKTASRIEITKILAELFRDADRGEIDKIVYLVLGKLAPNYESVVFNVAEKMVLAGIAQAYQKDSSEVRKIYKSTGDLGNAAELLSTENKGKKKDLSVGEVFEKLRLLAINEGEGSVERKITLLAELLVSLDALSNRYVARIPLGKLRLGFSDKTVLDALSWMEKGDKSGKAILDKAYQVVPDVGALAASVKEKGIASFNKGVTPVVGIPVLPMLAQRLKSPTEMVEKMGLVGIEPKFDGLRIQIHFKKGKFTKAFTRNLNETSWMFPELQRAGEYLNVTEVILDSEAVGVDEERKMMANFQTTMTRRRKHEIEKFKTSVPIKFYVFDILFKNGQSFMGETYLKRREILETITKDDKLFMVDEYKITQDPKVIADYAIEQIKKGLEGIMVKKAESQYVPGRTGWRWVKMKEEVGRTTKLADTVDCFIMGYTAGKGKRAGFGVGQFLAGVREGKKIKTITKVGTGLTDEQFRELKKRLGKIEVKEKPTKYEVNKNLEPDFWVTPSVVVELAADEITKSPNHTAGLALRFPRLVDFRDDKSARDVTTLTEIKNLFNLQKQSR